MAPPSEYLRAGREAAQEIFEHLKQNGYRLSFKVGRTKIAGSIGKKTAIAYETEDGTSVRPDFDLVVFMNDMAPPFDTVLNWFVDLLDEVEEVRNVRTTKISVRFNYDHSSVGEIRFDLLPAENHTKDTTGVDDIAKLEGQMALLQLTSSQMKAINKGQDVDAEENRLRSSGLCENTVAFIKTQIQDEFVLHVVRLAKFWNTNIELGKYVSARSCMIELIAIYSQQGKARDNLVSGFAHFLKEMENLSSLVVALGAAKSHKKVRALMSRRQAPGQPIILDPSNPFNNLANGMKPEIVKAFEFQAAATLKVLQNFGRRGQYKRAADPEDEIFCHKSYVQK